MNEINEIYEHLRYLGLCHSQGEFSANWLGRSSGYFAYLKSSGAAIDLSSVGMLIGRLKSICPDQHQSRDFEERARIRAALSLARVLYLGEWELRNLPSWARCTAI